jgi:hypothetical protein
MNNGGALDVASRSPTFSDLIKSHVQDFIMIGWMLLEDMLNSKVGDKNQKLYENSENIGFHCTEMEIICHAMLEALAGYHFE